MSVWTDDVNTPFSCDNHLKDFHGNASNRTSVQYNLMFLLKECVMFAAICCSTMSPWFKICSLFDERN